MSEIDTMSPEMLVKPKVIELEPLGYGNPNASIRYERPEIDVEDLTEQLKEATAEIISSGECLVDITEPDDGCIDGRTAVSVTYVDESGTERTVEIPLGENDHERAKVAGGGYVTGLAMELAIHPPLDGVEAVLQRVIQVLAEKNIFCGMHTGSHKKEDLGQTDCGANDKVETILENGLLFTDKIAKDTQNILEVAGATYDPAAQKQVGEGWARALSDKQFFAGSTGTSRKSVVTNGIKAAQATKESEKPVSVFKDLDSDHNERFIVVTFHEGKTFSQVKLREALRERFPDVAEELFPQVFVVDAPRIVELAQNITEDEAEQQIALQAGVSYQLASAATLTDGSLRVFAIN